MRMRKKRRAQLLSKRERSERPDETKLASSAAVGRLRYLTKIKPTASVRRYFSQNWKTAHDNFTGSDLSLRILLQADKLPAPSRREPSPEATNSHRRYFSRIGEMSHDGVE